MKPAMQPGAPSSPECALSVVPFHRLSSSDCSPPPSASTGSVKAAGHLGAPSSPECALSVVLFHRLSSSDCSPPPSASTGSPSQARVPSLRQIFLVFDSDGSFCTLTTYDGDCVCIGLASKFHWFLSKNKRHSFHFHQELYWTVYSQFCSTTFCRFFFFRQLHNSIFPKLFIFLGKELLQVSFMVFQGIEIFPLREFCKDQNKWNLKLQCPVIVVDESELPSQAVTVFASSSKKHGLELFWCKIMRFLLTNSRCFLSSAAFSLFNWEQVLVRINHLVFQKELIENPLPIPPYTQHHLWMKSSLMYDYGASFCLPHELFHST